MSVSGIASLATDLSNNAVKQDVGISVLKKALQAESATAATLIAALPTPPSANLPAHLGNSVNTTA
jgi:hypothetical protein